MAKYIFYPEIINQNINRITDAFKQKSVNFSHFYSVKTNSSTCVLDEIAKTKSSFEIVSMKEWHLVKKYKKSSIILNGPNKTISLVKNILKTTDKLIFNIDNDTDLEIIKKINPKQRRNILLGIRLYFTENKENWTRFGYDISSKDTFGLIKKIDSLYHLDGIQFHNSTLTVDLKNYQGILTKIKKLIKDSNLSINFVDIGGGYVESFNKKYQDNMYQIIPCLIKKEFDNLSIFSECGRNIVSDAFDLSAKIVSFKKINDEKYIVNLDTNIFHFMCFFDHRYEIMCLKVKNKLGNEKSKFNINIYGNSGMQIDTFALGFKINSPPKIGDVFLIKNIGAYSISMASDFITKKPTIGLVDYKNT